MFKSKNIELVAILNALGAFGFCPQRGPEVYTYRGSKGGSKKKFNHTKFFFI
ncbi:hypothetical protein CI610_02884 [invertebrate metagenome]|uniref:Uncharacterized protein n=1 Tax=invertebrate metagenome TaxID=1711999 RepID=A0A2H9T4N4_9ZZZZ